MYLHKLHGSTNWFARSIGQLDRSDVFVSSVYGGWKPQGHLRGVPQHLSDLVPLVIPPVSSKSEFYSNSVLRSQWRDAGEALRRAERLVVIGYSFPISDTRARIFVSTNLSPDAEVQVVDPNHSIADALSKLLPNPVEHVARDVDEYAEAFAPSLV